MQFKQETEESSPQRQGNRGEDAVQAGNGRVLTPEAREQRRGCSSSRQRKSPHPRGKGTEERMQFKQEESSPQRQGNRGEDAVQAGNGRVLTPEAREQRRGCSSSRKRKSPHPRGKGTEERMQFKQAKEESSPQRQGNRGEDAVQAGRVLTPEAREQRRGCSSSRKRKSPHPRGKGTEERMQFKQETEESSPQRQGNRGEDAVQAGKGRVLTPEAREQRRGCSSSRKSPHPRGKGTEERMQFKQETEESSPQRQGNRGEDAVQAGNGRVLTSEKQLCFK